jgi:lysozyme
MKTSQTGLNLIEQFEGLILGAYDDATDRIVPAGGTARGTLTIGYGHTSAAGAPRVYVGQRITKAQANSILASDLAKVEAWVNKVVKVPINQNQFDALVSFTFNCGNGALARSSLLRNLNQKKYQAAADAFLQWTRGNGQVLPGLVRRRKAERALFLKPYMTTITKDKVKGAVGGTIIAGGAATAATHPHLWHWVAVGTLVALVVGFIGFIIYEGKK